MKTFLLVAMMVLAAPLNTLAQCECDHVIPLDAGTWNGTENGVAPGERVCVSAGEREFLRLQSIRGSAESPVEVINCGGQVVIHNEDRAYALVVEDGSAFFHITGTGDPDFEYGFDISAPATEPYPGVGLWLVGLSTNYEADHLEIHHTGFAGVSAKTDPLCDGSADRANFTQYSTHLHHLYVHDTGGEGFYIGSTQSDGQTINCDGTSEVRDVHFLEGVEIHDNLIENTGWDGAQVGMARSGCRIYRNTIRHVGMAREMYQMQGLQIGTHSACEVFANVIEDGTANGIIVLGAGELFVHSNRIVGFPDGDGIYANHRDQMPGVRYRFAFNTIVNVGNGGITVFGGALGASEATGNLVVGSGEGIAAGGDVDWTDSNNIVLATAVEAGFVGDGDYHLGEGSPARGAGRAVEGIEFDLEGYPRASPPSAGAYEYREPGVDAGVSFDAGAGSDSGPSSGGDAGVSDAGPGGDTADGGGCGIAGGGTRPGLFVLVGVILFGRRRRSEG